MNIKDYAYMILSSPFLEDKITPSSEIDFSYIPFSKNINSQPAREEKIKFSNKKSKFPGTDSLRKESYRGKAIHFFANHELLAIELMAYILIKFEFKTESEKIIQKQIYSTLKDEQKHFLLYKKRMESLGVEFGDFPLNDFFWGYADKITSLEQYFSVMALTFESANLDFAKYYSDLFLEYDQESSKILDMVLKDEINHVALGVNYLNSKRQNKNLWDYYFELLPWPLTPMRSKGKILNVEARVRSGFDQHFINQQNIFNDNYAPTSRKEWKK